MKTNVYVFAGLLMACFAEVNGQNTRAQGDTMNRYYNRVASSGNEAEKAQLRGQLYQLLQNENEANWQTALRVFNQMKMTATADSVREAILLKFPDGQLAKEDAKKAIHEEKNAEKKDSLFRAWLKKYYPNGNFSREFDYDFMVIGNALASQGFPEKAVEYASFIKVGPYASEGRLQIANNLYAKGFYSEAVPLLEEAVVFSEDSTLYGNDRQTARMVATNAKYVYRSLAQVLYAQKNYEEALKAIQKSRKLFGAPLGSVNMVYANILMAMKREKKAFDILDEAIKVGQATPEMKDNLKLLYVRAKGSDAGWTEYEAMVRSDLFEKLKKDVARKMVNKPAPLFELKDLDGNTVSLASLKGKIVVLDFWANWCGPCKRGFPAMQLAVNKYKDDPDVKFYFIHTWEKGDKQAAEKARKYMQDMKFSFHVLMDPEDPATGENKVKDLYGISFIPQKYVIDKNGNIRFSPAGYHEGDDAAAEELSAMIELARGK